MDRKTQSFCPVFLLSFLLRTMVQYDVCFTAAFTREQDSKILKLLCLGHQLTPSPEELIPLLPGREPWPPSWRCWISYRPLHTSDHPSKCWRSCSDKTNRTMSSAKIRNTMPRSPKRTLSSTLMHPDILSMNIMNRIRGKGQPWSAHFGSTETGWLVTMAPVPHTPSVPPTWIFKGTWSKSLTFRFLHLYQCECLPVDP